MRVSAFQIARVTKAHDFCHLTHTLDMWKQGSDSNTGFENAPRALLGAGELLETGLVRHQQPVNCLQVHALTRTPVHVEAVDIDPARGPTIYKSLPLLGWEAARHV